VEKDRHLSKQVQENLMQASEIPNAPFLSTSAERFFSTQLETIDFQPAEIPVQTGLGKYWHSDEFALYVKVKNVESKHKLLIVSHLDHPYVLLDGKSTGTPLGSINRVMLQEEARRQPIPLHIYTQDGEYVEDNQIEKVDISERKTTVHTNRQTRAPVNSQAIWGIPKLDMSKDVIQMINADNMAQNAILLTIIQDLSDNFHNQPINVEFVFTHLEEIMQISATGIAQRGFSGFNHIDQNTSILVLENASVESPLSLQNYISGLKPANYQDGPIIRINDINLVYGQNQLNPNLAEDLLLQAAEEVDINYQHTLLSGACDATAFTLFSPTSNIASITIPTRYKHNQNEDGKIVPAEFKSSDLLGCLNLVRRSILIIGNGGISTQSKKGICQKLKESDYSNPKTFRRLKQNRLKTLQNNLHKIKARKFFPETTTEKLYFLSKNIKRKVKGLLE